MRSLRESYLPGDLGFDPMGLKPKDEAGFLAMQNKELNNGREQQPLEPLMSMSSATATQPRTVAFLPLFLPLIQAPLRRPPSSRHPF